MTALISSYIIWLIRRKKKIQSDELNVTNDALGAKRVVKGSQNQLNLTPKGKVYVQGKSTRSVTF